ncbi:efflux RND transporter periplasmic adaptor subunit [Glaciecola sp. MH2013]|uniref:efflux RND transporter periplasmic adaptor subunit n=1 Tax=Glaciecola sp. MH2013 TaxID=2785524 RepID=UPI00189E48F3|nr:efflux RND transporter periplasmic adaptor subunit [Glaciecola sp. MH2013]MBF7072055.1 efflux RND transporter periplasmic adaptor subunit [Glaciecola sp. MH2013]
MAHDKSGIEQNAKKVWTTTLIPAAEGRKRHLTGSIQAADAVAVSFELSGVINKMHVDLGQSFEKGDVLAELDTAVYELSVAQSRSNLGEANAAFIDAEQTYNRNVTLREQGLVSQAALDNAKAAFDIAQQRVDVAQSALSLAQENLSDTRLIAPYDGRVSARFAEPSQQVSPGAPILNIQGNAKLEVASALPEGLISKVTLFDPVDVIVLAINAKRRLPATLTEIGARATVANAFPITITLNDNYDGLYPGMSAEVILQVKSDFDIDGLYEVPFSAFTTDKNSPYIYVVESTPAAENDSSADQEHRVRRVDIEILELKADSAIVKLLDEHSPESNNIIVRTGLNFLRNGQAVSIVETETRIYNQ